MIKRKEFENKINDALKRSRAVALIGPRQCGKTTLARRIVDVSSTNYFDLEDPVDMSRLIDPKTALSSLKGIVVIDEVQLFPNLFPVLRVLLDRVPLPAKFLILGSASPELLRQSSETLAGRIEIIELDGLSLLELGNENMNKLWARDGFPLSFLADSDTDSYAWRSNFVKTFLERDFRNQGINLPIVSMHRFWAMIANCNGQIWNSAPIASSLGLSQPTIRKYLDIMTGLFMVRQIQPWHENIKKRQVKSPKIYIRDTGILHALLGIKNYSDILMHPICGSSWEGFIIEEIIRRINPDDVYYWATHQGAELDLLLFKDGKKYGFEIKRKDAPTITASMKIALETLGIEKLTVIYPGEKQYQLSDKIFVTGIQGLGNGL